MMFSRLCFLVLSFVVFGSNQAHAQTETLEAVEGSSLKLVGSGIIDQSSKDSVGHSCVGDSTTHDSEKSCSELRYVFFPANHKQAYFFGSKIPVAAVGVEPTEKQLKWALKGLRKSFDEYVMDI